LDHDSEIHFQPKAKIANEQQKTPSIKACSSKTVSVIFRSIQHRAQLKIFLTFEVFVKSTDITQLFQQKPSPFKLIAFVGKLDQDSGAT
jgi:hypothetical protein